MNFFGFIPWIRLDFHGMKKNNIFHSLSRKNSWTDSLFFKLTEAFKATLHFKFSSESNRILWEFSLGYAIYLIFFKLNLHWSFSYAHYYLPSSLVLFTPLKNCGQSMFKVKHFKFPNLLIVSYWPCQINFCLTSQPLPKQLKVLIAMQMTANVSTFSLSFGLCQKSY